jgi:hypothetical protein
MTDELIIPDCETNFAAKVRGLSSWKVKPFHEYLEDIGSIQRTLEGILVAKQCGLSQEPELKTLECAFSDDAYCLTTINLLTRELPIHDPEEYLEESGKYFLLAYPMGMNDWYFEQVVEDFGEPWHYGKEYSLIAFLLLLNFMIDDAEIWQACIDYFGWNVRPDEFELKDRLGFDSKYLRRYLARKGAPKEVITTVAVTFFPPEDNDLLCIGADDYENNPDCLTYDLDTENVRNLQKWTAQANPLIDQIEPAKKWTVENPWIIRVIGEGLVRSQERMERPLSCSQGWPM